MSCSYRVGGVENAVLTEVFNYVEDNPSGARAGFKIETCCCLVTWYLKMEMLCLL